MPPCRPSSSARPTDLASLRGRSVTRSHVLVVGGGTTAARRAATFARDGVEVTVVAPTICDGLLDLLLERSVTWEKRSPAAADLDRAWLVVPATGDPVADATVCRWVDRLRGRRGGAPEALARPRVLVV